MKSHRFRYNSQRHDTQRRQERAARTRPWMQAGLLALFMLLLLGLTLTAAPASHDGTAATERAGMAHLAAQESPLSPLSIALNNDAAVARRVQPSAGDPGAGGPSNLLRVMIVIAGVLLVTGIVFWRQR